MQYNLLPLAVRSYIEFLVATVEKQARGIDELEVRITKFEHCSQKTVAIVINLPQAMAQEKFLKLNLNENHRENAICK